MGCLGYTLISIVFTCSLFDCNWGYAIEPKCSKFPYEEALLEKLVRVEFSVEKMMESMQQTRSEVNLELEKLKSERESIERERNEYGLRIKEERAEFEVKVGSMEIDTTKKLEELSKNTESKLSNLEKDLNDNLEHAENVINRLSEDFQQVKNGTIQDIIELAKRQNILFRARQLKDLSPGSNQKLVFQTVLENTGDGYNQETGIFTTPVSGDYLFTVQLCSDSTNDFVFSFMRDGIEQQRLEFQQGSYGCGTAVYVTNAKDKSEIWIESKRSYVNSVLYKDSDRWNVFSGILVR